MELLKSTMETARHLWLGSRRPGNRVIGAAVLPRDPFRRIVFHRTGQVSAWGWPSRGGLIVLTLVTAVHMEFLGLDPLSPPLRRDRDQDAEDQFCQQLLCLGAKWFDSRSRHSFVVGVEEEDDRDVEALLANEEPRLSTMERRWFGVGIPSTGGVWVAEYDTGQPFMPDWTIMQPEDTSRVLLARSMDERCEILKRMGAKFYSSVDDYDGAGCLRAWAEKTTGEVGPLVYETMK